MRWLVRPRRRATYAGSVQCDYYDAGVCGSCALIEVPYPVQVRDGFAQVRDTLAAVVDDGAWAPPVTGPESGFRNKAKLVVGGTVAEPTLGILDADRRGVDLRACGLYEPALGVAVRAIGDVLPQLGLVPYDVARRSGELKHLLVTASPASELMVRFVLRSPGQLNRVRRGLDLLSSAVPGLRVVSVNLQPEHKAVLEGEQEILLTEQETLPMDIAGVRLHLRPNSFFQTNTVVAGRLYRTAAAWARDLAPRTMWDLYCGVGGFGLSIAADTPSLAHVLGIEVAPDSVASAARTAEDLRRGGSPLHAAFQVGDADRLLVQRNPADLVLVNPPRRGIGPLAGALEDSGATEVFYSSCNPASLAKDLAAMPSLRPVAAQMFDMFPQTRHHEVLVHLRRR